MNSQINELQASLNKIKDELLSLDDDNFNIKILNINSHIAFFKNYKEKVRKEAGEEIFRLIEKELIPNTKQISGSFDNIINKIKQESNSLLVKIKIVENKKKINSYRSYDEC